MIYYPWQKNQWEKLSRQFLQHQLPHALLLTGIKGLGKFQFAKKFSQFILCSSPRENQSCGVCRNCHLFETNNHPDFFPIQSEENNNIKIDQIRTLITDLMQTPKCSAYQVVLIEPADSMNTASFNSLLKTLEEPLGNVIFLLVSSRAEKLPLTILSRCQKINFYADESFETLQWLAQYISDEEEAKLFLHAACGAPLKVLQLQDENYIHTRDEFFKYISDEHLSVLKAAQVFSALPAEIILDYFYTWCLDIFKLQLKTNTQFITYADKIADLKIQAEKISTDALKKFLIYLSEAKALQLSNLHLNPQLFFEDLFFRWASLFA